MSEDAEHDSGAKIVRDPRVSRGIQITWGIIGSLLVIAVAAVAKNLWDVNLTLRDVLAESRAVRADLDRNDARDDRQDLDIRDLQRDVSTQNCRNMRGGSEPRRGN